MLLRFLLLYFVSMSVTPILCTTTTSTVVRRDTSPSPTRRHMLASEGNGYDG